MGTAFLVRRIITEESDGSGGVGLNFEVVGGTTQLTAPRENTIWINTDAEITGWTFQVDEPANANEGMVWVETYSASGVSFNALTENGVYVYPLATKQYIGGAWVAVDSEIYANGAWTSLYADIDIYRDGVENETLTGGWSSGGTVTNDAEQKRLVFKGKVTASSRNKIDLRGFSTIVFIAQNATGASSKFGVGTTATEFVASKTIAAYADLATYSLDISSLNDEAGYYLLVTTASTTNPTSFTEIVLCR